jgi:hypothetical protein
MFRLFRTNEAPIRHVPTFTLIYGPWVRFLGHTNVAFANTPILFRAVVKDLDNDALAFSWRDLQNGQPVAGEASVSHYPANVLNYTSYSASDDARLISEPTAFQPGVHTIQVVASDGIFSATNTYTFEVISAEMASQEFSTAIQALAIQRGGRAAASFVELAARAARRGNLKLADRHWRRFQRHLQRITSLSEEERDVLSSAAAQIQSLAQTQ